MEGGAPAHVGDVRCRHGLRNVGRGRLRESATRAGPDVDAPRQAGCRVAGVVSLSVQAHDRSETIGRQRRETAKSLFSQPFTVKQAIRMELYTYEDKAVRDSVKIESGHVCFHHFRESGNYHLDVHNIELEEFLDATGKLGLEVQEATNGDQYWVKAMHKQDRSKIQLYSKMFDTKAEISKALA